MSSDLSSIVTKAVELLEETNQKDLAGVLRRATVEEGDTYELHGYNVPDSSVTTIRVRLHQADQASKTEYSRQRIGDILQAAAGQGVNYFVELE